MHISGVLSHRGFGVCLCVWMWVRRLLKAFPPTQSTILAIDGRASTTQEWRPRAGTQGDLVNHPSLIFDLFHLVMHSLILNKLS